MDFQRLKDLGPPAFKLYAYLIYRYEQGKDTLTIPLVDLGYESGLQPARDYRGERHGLDGQVRNALNELIERGLVELVERGRGRTPNTYRVIR
jgi:hypothetical protein